MRISYFFDEAFVAEEQLLLSAAERVFAAELDKCLLELARRFSGFEDLFQNDAWHRIEVGVLLERVGQVVVPLDATLMAEMPDGFQLVGFGQFRHWIFNTLLQVLPIDALPATLLERRLAVELGV
ncbi:hypothetical protein [Pseudomonas sp. BF-R-01]|uniref:hypothetical protein n=1 Tax=Pseudomonas sp. BF-R-01 TaxID=2832365 RepID=UPI001CBB3751|nr:hypothetical protein [Pseudomonas sp. BF-R-01]